MSRIASNVDSVVENIEKEIEQNANVCNITKSIDIKPTKDARQKKIEFTVNEMFLQAQFHKLLLPPTQTSVRFARGSLSHGFTAKFTTNTSSAPESM